MGETAGVGMGMAYGVQRIARMENGDRGWRLLTAGQTGGAVGQKERSERVAECLQEREEILGIAQR